MTCIQYVSFVYFHLLCVSFHCVLLGDQEKKKHVANANVLFVMLVLIIIVIYTYRYVSAAFDFNAYRIV